MLIPSEKEMLAMLNLLNPHILISLIYMTSTASEFHDLSIHSYYRTIRKKAPLKRHLIGNAIKAVFSVSALMLGFTFHYSRGGFHHGVDLLSGVLLVRSACGLVI